MEAGAKLGIVRRVTAGSKAQPSHKEKAPHQGALLSGRPVGAEMDRYAQQRWRHRLGSEIGQQSRFAA
jgi:hypothetical protein